VPAHEAFTVAKPRVAAGALFRDEAGRILLVKPSYKLGWDIPGGYVEPGETPRQACLREIEEELGIDVAVGRPLVIDWAPAPGEGDKVLFVFDGGILSSSDQASIKLQAEELDQFDVFDRSALTEVLNDRLQRRIFAAIEATQTGSTTYLEPTLEP